MGRNQAKTLLSLSHLFQVHQLSKVPGWSVITADILGVHTSALSFGVDRIFCCLFFARMHHGHDEGHPHHVTIQHTGRG